MVDSAISQFDLEDVVEDLGTVFFRQAMLVPKDMYADSLLVSPNIGMASLRRHDNRVVISSHMTSCESTACC